MLELAARLATAAIAGAALLAADKIAAAAGRAAASSSAAPAAELETRSVLAIGQVRELDRRAGR